ncbi:MAG: hypothetical protein M3163_07715 [Actinomycetota bacterium]|nr:hypothetical protein [Actinomycetota bacterium]
MRRPSCALATVAGVVMLSIAGCSSSSPPAAGRLSVDGQAELLRPGEDRVEVDGSRDLKLGDRVRIRQGSGVIRLSGDRKLELRTGSDLELQSAQTPAEVRPTLVGGDLLVVSDGQPFAVGTTGADVAVQGDARISRGAALLVATYEGTAQLSAGGSTLAVPALRQASLPATGQFPGAVTPLEYSAGDGWDQRYLSDAIDVSNQLTGRSDGFAAQLGPNEGRSVAFFKDLYPRLAAEPAFTASLLNPIRSPGETLVGAAITLEGTRGTFAERWAAVFAFRDQGAPWGLVVRDQGVDRVAVLRLVEDAAGRRPSGLASGPAVGTPNSPPTPGAGPTTTVRSRANAATTTTTPASRPRPGVTTTAPSPASGPTTTVVTGPLNTGSPLVDETVNSLVNTLTGLLNSLGQQP